MDISNHQDRINKFCEQREAINTEIRKLEEEIKKERDRIFQEEFNNYGVWLKENPNSNPISASILYRIHKEECLSNPSPVSISLAKR